MGKISNKIGDYTNKITPINLPGRGGIWGEIKEGQLDLKAFNTKVVNTDITVMGAISENTCMYREVTSRIESWVMNMSEKK